MAVTVTEGRGTITIVPNDTDDFIAGVDTDIKDYLVSSIQFIPSAQSDRLVLRDKGIDGIEKFDTGLTPGTSPIFKNFDPPQWLMPVIDKSDCVFGTAGNCKIIIDYI